MEISVGTPLTPKNSPGLRLFLLVTWAGPVGVLTILVLSADLLPALPWTSRIVLIGAGVAILGFSLCFRSFLIRTLTRRPQSIEWSENELVLTEQSGMSVKVRWNDPALAFNLTRGEPDPNSTGVNFQSKMGPASAARSISTEGFGLLINSARAAGATIHEEQSPPGKQSTVLVRVRGRRE
jgi:hypothetical protein